MPEERRACFRKEVRNWLREIQTMRLKDSGRPGKAAWYYGLLYDGPFGGFEERNVATVCEGIEERYEGGLVRNGTPVPVLVERLRAFHGGSRSGRRGARRWSSWLGRSRPTGRTIDPRRAHTTTGRTGGSRNGRIALARLG
jgi:hypothetical protein